MHLTETSPVPSAALPVALLRDHLRLSSGFADDTTQDALLEQYLRAALGRIEARLSRALFRRGYVLRLAQWRNGQTQALLIAPVLQITSVTVLAADGSALPVAASRYRLDPDSTRPRIMAAGTALPTIPTGGAVEIAFDAGLGVTWDDIPADLRQAVLLLAAHFYEARDAAGAMAPSIASLLERWQDIRLGGRP
ncbi:MAG: head-tail connector protein [Roseinatronobacter sp.]